MAMIPGCWELLLAGLMFYTLLSPNLVRAAWGNILISGVLLTEGISGLLVLWF